jgi:hypothetical protein
LSGLRARSAASASAVEFEKRVSASAWWPNAITSIRSAAPFAAMNVRAAATASASGLPLIDCELSISRTTLFARPRLWASRPVTGTPSSRSAGWALPGGATTVTRSSG